MYAPSKHSKHPFLLFFLVCQAMLALRADPPYIFAVDHDMKVDILLVVVSQLVEEVQNPLPVLRGGTFSKHCSLQPQAGPVSLA